MSDLIVTENITLDGVIENAVDVPRLRHAETRPFRCGIALSRFRAA